MDVLDVAPHPRRRCYYCSCCCSSRCLLLVPPRASTPTGGSGPSPEKQRTEEEKKKPQSTLAVPLHDTAMLLLPIRRCSTTRTLGEAGRGSIWPARPVWFVQYGARHITPVASRSTRTIASSNGLPSSPDIRQIPTPEPWTARTARTARTALPVRLSGRPSSWSTPRR